jgi:hypothetical protein
LDPARVYGDEATTDVDPRSSNYDPGILTLLDPWAGNPRNHLAVQWVRPWAAPEHEELLAANQKNSLHPTIVVPPRYGTMRQKVTRIEWTFHTSQAEGSGTDARVSVEIYRDGQLLASPDDEPGETGRLDRGEVATRGWTFVDPKGLGSSIGGFQPPYAENFPHGAAGHLKVRLCIHGDDAWRIGDIESTVISGNIQLNPTTGLEWVEFREHYVFRGEDVLSTNPNEGSNILPLDY